MNEIRAMMRLMVIERKDIFLAILFGFLAGISTVALFANSGYIISSAALMPPLYLLTICIALLKLFTAVRAFSRYAERYYSHRATFTMLSQLRTYFYAKLEPIAPFLLQHYRSGDLLSRIVGDVENLQHFFLRVFYPPIVMLLVFLTTILFTALFSFLTATILLVGLVLSGLIIPLLILLKQRKNQDNTRSLRGQLSTNVAELLHGYLDLKLYDQLSSTRKAIQHSSKAYIDKQSDRGKQELMGSAINQWVALIISWLVIAVGAYLVTSHELNGVYLAMLVLISLTVFENIASISEAPYYFEENRSAAARLYTVIEAAAIEKGSNDEKRKWNCNKAPSIELNNVTFYYPNELRPALLDINLHFARGSKTAIVGPSGSGKSTILGLLLKQYKPSEGFINFNGISLEEVEEDAHLAGVTAVLQNNHFFYGTVRDNLNIAGEKLTDQEMIQALMDVNLNQISLDSPVLEKGANLSGGEKQRLAIARALLKKNRLWLLDEPTSSVDVLNSKRIYHKLFESSKESTTILISHQLTNLEEMDQIIVMDRGRVVESGTFQELMNKKGYFYQLKMFEATLLFNSTKYI